MREQVITYMNKRLLSEKELFKTSFFTTMIVGFITHGFFFSNLYYIHDNASAAIPVESSFEGAGSAAGRWLSDYVYLITLDARIPWLGGIIGIIMVALAAYLICNYLSIRTRIGVILVGCICVANRTLIFSNMYGGLYGFTIALLLACSALFFFKKEGLGNYIIAVICATGAYSTYGAYAMVMSSIMLLGIIFDILDGKTALESLKKTGLMGLLHVCAFMLYMFLNNLVMSITGRNYASYLGREKVQSFGMVFKSVVNNISVAYLNSIKRIIRYQIGGLEPSILVRIIVVATALLAIAVLIQQWKVIKDKRLNICILLTCVLVFPISLNYIELLMSLHVLMDYSYIVIYIATVKLIENIDFKKWVVKPCVLVSYFLIIVLVYDNVLVANMAYVHLDDMYRNTVSLGTRIIDRIESCEGYEGTEPCVIIGDVLHNPFYNIAHTYGMPGLDDDMVYLSKERQHVISENGLTVPFLYYSLGAPMQFIRFLTTKEYEESGEFEIDKIEDIRNMPEFPCDGSVIKREGIIFVKISQ